jgi:hypothetical protein
MKSQASGGKSFWRDRGMKCTLHAGTALAYRAYVRLPACDDHKMKHWC